MVVVVIMIVIMIIVMVVIIVAVIIVVVIAVVIIAIVVAAVAVGADEVAQLAANFDARACIVASFDSLGALVQNITGIDIIDVLELGAVSHGLYFDLSKAFFDFDTGIALFLQHWDQLVADPLSLKQCCRQRQGGRRNAIVVAAVAVGADEVAQLAADFDARACIVACFDRLGALVENVASGDIVDVLELHPVFHGLDFDLRKALFDFNAGIALFLQHWDQLVADPLGLKKCCRQRQGGRRNQQCFGKTHLEILFLRSGEPTLCGPSMTVTKPGKTIVIY